jgi:uroporphyrinogen decarboxylase
MRREEPDRVPFGFTLGFTPGAMNTFKRRSGAEDPHEYFATDSRGVGFSNPKQMPDYARYFAGETLPPGTWIGPYGAHAPGSVAHFTHIISPLRHAARLDQIEAYPLPDFTQPECHAHLADQVAAHHRAGQAVLGRMTCTLFEFAWQIRGMEEFLSDLCERYEWAEALVEKFLRIRLFQAAKLAEAGVDILCLGDDVGMQTGMMISPAVWRRLFKGRMARLIETARAIKPDILTFYHSDGDVRAIVPELIEIGLDILNPVQPECVDPAEMKRLYGDRLSFWDTIGTQSTFPFGTPEDMRRVVRERIATVGRGGGLYLGPTHSIEPEVPWENIVAFVEAAREYGRYRA